MASYKYYSNTLTAGNNSFTHDIDGDLARTGRSGYIKNTGNNALTFALKFEGDTTFGDNVTLAAGEVHGFDRGILWRNNTLYIYTGKHKNDFVSSIKVDYVSADTTYKIYID